MPLQIAARRLAWRCRITPPFMRRLLLLTGLLSLPAATAQPADPCPEGTAVGILEGGNVRAALYPNGTLFYGPGHTSNDGYLVPTSGEDAGKSTIFAAALVLSGRVHGEPRASASVYTNPAFRPGAAGPDATPPTPAECAAADRIVVVSRDDVARYLADGALIDDLRDWPVHLGAPVLDGDGDPANYNLTGGDQPAIRGDVTAFWAMTDTARRDTLGDGSPLGVDVAVEAVAFRAAPFAPSPASPLASVTVYRYTVTNRAGEPIHDLHAGLFMDTDLGDYTDDYVGTDTTHATAFVYNADEEDGFEIGYGVPPAFGVVVVDGPRGDDGRSLGLTATLENAVSSPASALSAHCQLQGLTGGCEQRIEGPFPSPPGGTVTRFAYAGDPVTAQFWSEENTDGQGSPSPPSDRRILAGSGPLTLAPDASASWTFALVFAQGTDRLDSVARLRQRAVLMHSLQDAGVLEPTRVVDTSTPPPAPPRGVRRPAPNPFDGTTALTLRGLAGEAVTLTVADVLGRTVERRDVTPTADDVDVALGAGLAPGVYVVRVAGRGFALGFPVVKSR